MKKLNILLLSLLVTMLSCKTSKNIIKAKIPQEKRVNVLVKDTVPSKEVKEKIAVVVVKDTINSNLVKEKIAVVVEKDTIPSNVAKEKITKVVEKNTIKLMAVGDIMLGTTFPNASYLPPKNLDPFADVYTVLQKADVLFGNFEGTLTDTGKNAKHCKDPSKCYSFRSPSYLGDYLQQAGFDVVSIANNHIGDFGKKGLKNTVANLNTLGIANAGVLSKPTTVFEKDGIRYGLIAFAPNKDCLKLNNVTKGVQMVKKLAKKVDFVIVSFHGGAEGTKHKHITRKREVFYGENRGNVYSFAHKMIDAGASVILGHGPHVPRAIEVYKGKFIAYSMGNFATYKRFSMSGSKAYAPIFELKLEKNGNFISGKIHSALQSKTRYPFIDKTKKALTEIKKLTLADFPENKIKFFDNGKIELKKE